MHDALARFINIRQVALPLHSLCNFLNFSPILPKKIKQDINKLESVQRRFTGRLQGLRNFSYETRLTHLGLDSLRCRRTKTDLLTLLQNY